VDIIKKPENWEWRRPETVGCRHTLRLKPFARRLVEEMQRPGVLAPDGCTMGDVIEVALREVQTSVVY
jgi:hypothetical protein